LTLRRVGGRQLGDGPCLLVAGGIGIAPVTGILRALADEGDDRPLVLVCRASRTSSSAGRRGSSTRCWPS
jgi:ferredoxin-NADP reductase